MSGEIVIMKSFCYKKIKCNLINVILIFVIKGRHLRGVPKNNRP